MHVTCPAHLIQRNLLKENKIMKNMKEKTEENMIMEEEENNNSKMCFESRQGDKIF
jgi:hypothetical protein